MALVSSWGPALDAASGVFFIVLGLLVLRVKPRRRVNGALAVFCMSLGVVAICGNVLTSDEPLQLPVRAVGIVAAVPTGAALVALALWFPRPLAAGERRVALACGALTAVAGGAYVAVAAATADNNLSLTSYRVLLCAFWFALLLLALRFPAREDAPPRVRQQFLLMSAALLIWPATIAGTDFLAGVLGGPSPVALARTRALASGTTGILALAVLALLWLRHTRALQPPESRWARDTAWLALGLPVAGMALIPLLGSALAAVSGPPGAFRIATVVLLAYAILRHQLLDIDVKVKWGISRGTLAAIFIAVFFVVSQVAQNYFSSFGVLAGGVAAGLMLFALAPLQRVAERVAEAAMPGVKPAAEMTATERLRVYRDQARLAWADGRLVEEERVLLDGLRKSLGITAEDALQVEREAAAAR